MERRTSSNDGLSLHGCCIFSIVLKL
jgi:hypothetical protein